MSPSSSPGGQGSRSVGRRRRRRWCGVAISAVTWLACTAVVGAVAGRREAAQGNPPQVNVARPLAGFSLVDPAGHVVTDRDLRGRFALVSFGYTTCSAHCPMTLAKLVAALETLDPKRRRFQPVFITVDPDHDTPETMGRFVDRFHGYVLGLTGSAAQIELVERRFGVDAAFRRTGPAVGDYVIDHPSVVYLMGPDGRLTARISTDGSDAELVGAIARRL
jgi:protein SCO1/2